MLMTLVDAFGLKDLRVVGFISNDYRRLRALTCAVCIAEKFHTIVAAPYSISCRTLRREIVGEVVRHRIARIELEEVASSLLYDEDGIIDKQI